MALSPDNLAILLVALSLLLCAAHGTGFVFKRLRQPPVVGEILGGLILGPTLLGVLSPSIQSAIFSDREPVVHALSALYHLGLLLLMFCSGLEMSAASSRHERKTIVGVTIAGTVLPLLLGFMALPLFNIDALMGAAQNSLAFVLVFGISIAVTSIPVISRVFMDLNIMDTSFARIVLACAVMGDVLLYVILSVALAVASGTAGNPGPLATTLGLGDSTAAKIIYHIVAAAAFFVAALVLGPPLARRLSGLRYNVVKKSSPIAGLLVFMFLGATVAHFLGIAPMLGAFGAGVAVGRSMLPGKDAPSVVIKSFSSAFLIPIYFAIVGLRLDLLTSFDPLFFLVFLVVACVILGGCVYAGARATGESSIAAWNFAFAMNARGGPGIVVASVAYDNGIISEQFFISLVLLAVVTSLLAGSWLSFVLRRGWPLR